MQKKEDIFLIMFISVTLISYKMLSKPTEPTQQMFSRLLQYYK